VPIINQEFPLGKSCDAQFKVNGITVKKLLQKRNLVIIVLNTCSLLIIEPQVPNSNRMIIVIEDPSIPPQNEKIKYNIPISL